MTLPRTVSVSLLPALIEPGELVGRTAVVIDVLRASTTIVHALAHGAKSVVPCLNVEDARAVAADLPRDEYVLGGERHCQLIDGFDLDNSPLKYTPEVVAGKDVIFTTTNGTKALQSCAEASDVFISAFVNQSALVKQLKQQGRSVHLLCAGTDGHLTGEDILFAGAIVHALSSQSADANAFLIAGVQAQMAIDFFLARGATYEALRKTINSSRGAQNLIRLNLQADIDRCAHVDFLSVVPRWNNTTNRITTT